MNALAPPATTTTTTTTTTEAVLSSPVQDVRTVTTDHHIPTVADLDSALEKEMLAGRLAQEELELA